MAVAPMTKLHVVIHSAERDAVLQRIYDLGIIQAIEVQEEAPQEHTLQRVSEEVAGQIAQKEGHLREVKRSLEILAQYDDSGRELIENFITLKQRIPRRKMESVRGNFDFTGISQQLLELTETLKHRQDEETWLQEDITLLDALRPVPFPLEELRSTRQVRTVIGQVRKEGKTAFMHDVTQYDDVYCEEISETGQFAYLFLMYCSAEATAAKGGVLEVLEQHGFDELDLSRFAATVPEEINRLTGELAEVRERIEQLENELRSFVQYLDSFKIIEESLENEIERYKDIQNFAETPKVYFLEGWMKQQDTQRLKHALREYDDAIDIHYEDADPDDEAVPVILENPWYIQPLELITRMFGMPKYNELDPTPSLSAFFILFFGLCLTDAGYGILLIVFMVLLMRKYVLDSGTTQLARLLMYGGISTVVCGALTGGWFGNILESLPESLGFIVSMKESITVLDPMTQPIAFLVLALILGFIQVCYGIWLKMKQHIDQGNINDAFLDEGVWLVFVNSLFFMAVVTASGAGASLLGQGLNQLFITLALLSGAIRVWFHNRDEDKVVKRVLLGILSLYDIVGIFSDVLSYSRLLALGLATGVIAMIIDMLTMMMGGIPGIGWLFGILLFVFGHIFNLIINTLGAFIHSGRLQFVEFFSKFFEAGGKKYKPFKYESRYFEITE